MEYLFNQRIIDWQSWGKVFQSIPAFENLIEAIFIKEGLRRRKIANLTPGTNAVFQADDLVIKIFAPPESGKNFETDYNVELYGMRYAADLGISCPKVVAASEISDRYLFRYIIMERLSGKDARYVLKKYDENQKKKFARQIHKMLKMLNKTLCNPIFKAVKDVAFTHDGWRNLPEWISKQGKKRIDDLDLSNGVYVHGDITGDNVLIDENGNFFLIDFADAKTAPAEYEYLPVLFDLFDFDKIMMREFIMCEFALELTEKDIREFTKKCFNGVLMHEYGFSMIPTICEKTGIHIDTVSNLSEIEEALFVFFKNLI